jgi:hypothetical protein
MDELQTSNVSKAQPLDVLLLVMRHAVAQQNHELALRAATAAAPYCHHQLMHKLDVGSWPASVPTPRAVDSTPPSAITGDHNA